MVEVALLVGRDPRMAARFLQVANSPLNLRVCKIETVSHAVSILGIRQVHDIVLSVSVAKAFEGMKTDVMDMKKFWQRGFYWAVMIQQLALEGERKDCDRLFVIGLLHNIVDLFMYRAIPKESQQTILKSKKSGGPLYQIEKEILGFVSATLGRYVMRRWDLPKSFQETTSFHPEPGNAVQFAEETTFLHISSRLVMSDLEAGSFGEGLLPLIPQSGRQRASHRSNAWIIGRKRQTCLMKFPIVSFIATFKPPLSRRNEFCNGKCNVI